MAKSRKSRERRYRLVTCKICGGTGRDEAASSTFHTAVCKTCKGVGRVKMLVSSK